MQSKSRVLQPIHSEEAITLILKESDPPASRVKKLAVAPPFSLAPSAGSVLPAVGSSRLCRLVFLREGSVL